MAFLYVSLYSNIRYLLKFVDPRFSLIAVVVLAFVILLTYLIQIII